MVSTSTINHRWWASEQPGKDLVDSCEDIARRERWRTAELRRAWRLYSGRKWRNLRTLGRENPRVYDSTDGLVRYNVIASIVETIVAKMSKTRPAPSFVTNGADWKTRRLADKLNKFGKGVLYASGVYDQLDELLKEWAVTGTCAVKFCAEGKEIKAERALLWELFVPPWEAERGDPRTLMQRTPVDRDALRDRFGSGDGKAKRLAAIEMSKAPDHEPDEAVGSLEEGADMVYVYEGWRLGTEGKAGRHVIAVQGGVLVDEEWDAEAFPFAFMRYSKLPASFWGVGVAQRQAGVQFEVNNLLQKIQLNTHLLANPVTILPANSGIPDAHITNDIGAIVQLPPGSDPPTRLTMPVMPGEVYEQVETHIRRAYEAEGVSQLSASSRKPAGLDAAVALREYSDIESERFLPQGRELERFVIQCVERCIALAEKIPGYEVDTMDRRWNERIAWKDIKTARDKFVLQCFPVSSLPQNPAARKQFVQELAQAGWISVDKAKELIDIPDLEEGMSTELGSDRLVRKQVAAILDGDEFEPPDPRLNLQSALKFALGVYNFERSNGMPEDVAEMLRTYLDQLEQMMIQAQKAAAPPPAAAAPPPVAAASAMPAMGPPMAA